MINFFRNVAAQLHTDALIAIGLATLASVIIGFIYYAVLRRAWQDAAGMTDASAQASRSISTYLIAGFCYALLALALFGVTWHASYGQITLRASLIAAALAWLGFIFSTMLANHRFHGRPFRLTVINAGHWLIVIFAQALIIGRFGSP